AKSAEDAKKGKEDIISFFKSLGALLVFVVQYVLSSASPWFSWFHPWRTSSQTMCGSCGPISFSHASRTAADEPGIEMTIRPRYVPAVARDIIAAGPISR